MKLLIPNPEIFGGLSQWFSWCPGKFSRFHRDFVSVCVRRFMHRSNLGRETQTNLLSKAILEPENNASFLKPQLIVQKKALLSFDLFTSKSPNNHFLFPSGPPQVVVEICSANFGRPHWSYRAQGCWTPRLPMLQLGLLSSKAPMAALSCCTTGWGLVEKKPRGWCVSYPKKGWKGMNLWKYV